jgi:hypothetical protein
LLQDLWTIRAAFSEEMFMPFRAEKKVGNTSSGETNQVFEKVGWGFGVGGQGGRVEGLLVTSGGRNGNNF